MAINNKNPPGHNLPPHLVPAPLPLDNPPNIKTQQFHSLSILPVLHPMPNPGHPWPYKHPKIDHNKNSIIVIKNNLYEFKFIMGIMERFKNGIFEIFL
jgi:hypothetical protein